MRRKPVLVIGGLGYVGTSLCAHLVARGHQVESCDMGWFTPPGQSACRNHALDYRLLPSLYVNDFPTVVLLAGHSSVPMSLKSGAPSTFNNNVRNLVTLAGRMRPGQRLIYASSASVYSGVPGDATEDGPTGRPTNCYDRSKVAADAAACAAPDGVEVYSLRFGTVNGGGAHVRVDVMMNAMYHAARTRGEVLGTNPDVRRPILSLGDLCRAVAHLVVTQDAAPGVYNVSSFNATVRGMAEAVAAHAGVPLRWTEPGPAYDMGMDTRKLARAGFRARDGMPEVLRSLDEHYDAARKTTRAEGVWYA